ncbi:MAG: pseudouridine synthase [Acidobacteriota bacterium]
MALERLQKLIARAGLCSRRDAEALIRERRVTVNGRVAELGEQADLDHDAVKIDGKRLKPPAALRYLLVNKPVGVVTTTEDPEGRPTVLDLVRGKVGGRLFPVGRLDYASEGLVILTNDGDLAQKLMHPRYGVLREYEAKVRGVPDESARARLRAGIVIAGRKVVPAAVEQLRVTPSGLRSWWRVVVGEGKTHEVRELFKSVGHPVQRLIRTAVGELRDPRLRPGAWRELDEYELDLLRRGGRRTRRGEHAPGANAGVHQQDPRVRTGKADRGGPARARPRRGDQAGLQREPARRVTKSARRHPQGAS